MTKYYYTCEEDRSLIKKSFNNIALMIFGKGEKNRRKIDAFDDYFEKYVSEVNIYPDGTKTKNLSSETPGMCGRDKDGKIIISKIE